MPSCSSRSSINRINSAVLFPRPNTPSTDTTPNSQPPTPGTPRPFSPLALIRENTFPSNLPFDPSSHNIPEHLAVEILNLLNQPEIKAPLLRLIDHSKDFLKDLRDKQNTTNKEFSKTLNDVFTANKFLNSFFRLPTYLDPKEFEDLYRSLYHFLQTGLTRDQASDFFLRIHTHKTELTSASADKKPSLILKIESYFKILAAYIKDGSVKHNETGIVKYYCKVCALKTHSIDSLLDYYERNNDINLNALSVKKQDNVTDKNVTTKIANQIKDSPFFDVSQNKVIGVKHLFYFVLVSYYSNFLHSLQINKEFLERYLNSHTTDPKLFEDISKHLQRPHSTKEVSELELKDVLLRSLTDFAKQNPLETSLQLIGKIPLEDFLKCLNNYTHPDTIFCNVITIIKESIHAKKKTTGQKNTSFGSLNNIQAITTKCLRDLHQRSEEALQGNDTIMKIYDVLNQEVGQGNDTIMKTYDVLNQDLKTILDFIENLNNLPKSLLKGDLDIVSAFFGKVIASDTDKYPQYQHLHTCLTAILEQYRFDNVPIPKSSNPFLDIKNARLNIIPGETFEESLPTPLANRVLGNLSSIWFVYLLCIELFNSSGYFTLFKLLLAGFITLGCRLEPQKPEGVDYKTKYCALFFLNDLNKRVILEKRLFETMFKESNQYPEKYFSTNASLEPLRDNPFSYWFQQCATELLVLKGTNSLNNYGDLRRLLKTLFIKAWFGYPLESPSIIDSSPDLSEKEKKIAKMVWIAGPKFEELSVTFLMNDIRLNFSALNLYPIKPSNKEITSALCKMQIMLYLLFCHQKHIDDTTILEGYEDKSTYLQLTELLKEYPEISDLLDLNLLSLSTTYELMTKINIQIQNDCIQTLNFQLFFDELKDIFVTGVTKVQLEHYDTHIHTRNAKFIYFHKDSLAEIFKDLLRLLQEHIIPLTVWSSTLTVSQIVAAHLNHPNPHPANFKEWEIALIERVYNFSLSQRFQKCLDPNHELQWKENVISGLCNFESYKNSKEELEQFDPVRLQKIAIEKIIESYIKNLSEDQFKQLSKKYNKTDLSPSEFLKQCKDSSLSHQVFFHIFQIINPYEGVEPRFSELGMGPHAIRTQSGHWGSREVALEAHRSKHSAFMSKDPKRKCPYAVAARSNIKMLLKEFGSYFVVEKDPSSFLGSLSEMLRTEFDPFRPNPLRLVSRADFPDMVTRLKPQSFRPRVDHFVHKYISSTKAGSLMYGVTTINRTDPRRSRTNLAQVITFHK